jgi:sugar transferase (PEP-CTERM system associated)
MRIRILGQYGNAALLLLWVAEFLALCLVAHLVGVATGWRGAGAAVWLQPVSFALFATLGLIAMGLYSPRQRDRVLAILLRLSLAMLLGMAAAMALSMVLPGMQFSIRTLLMVALASLLVVALIRLLSQKLLTEDTLKKRVLVYGSGHHAFILSRLRRRADRRGFMVVGYITSPGDAPMVPSDLIVPLTGNLVNTVAAKEVDEIVIAMDDRRQSFPTDQLLECRLAGIDVTELVTFLERETGKLQVEVLNASWLIFSSGFRRDIFRRYSERSFDLVVSLLMLAVSWPFMLLVALAIKLEDGWRAPVLYRQLRVGYCGALFNVIKFRSMRIDAEQDGKAVWATTNDARVTRVGNCIRKLRLDELPQLLTVLKGDMGFVGPRPERPEFVEQLAEKIPFYRERHYVKPGITGWAQLCYPYGASEQDALEKLQYDLYYVKNHGLLFDILIMLQTVEVILLGKGAR